MAIEACSNYITSLSPDECLSTSLTKINNNFLNLEGVVCDLKQRVDKVTTIRTFFYYGPNSDVDATSGMADNITSRPSNTTIRAFVNSSTQLNLPAISTNGDVAYVIYQKTGFLSSKLVNIPADFAFDKTTTDIYNDFAPIFIIWRLTYTGDDYTVDIGYPRFSQGRTSNTPSSNWDIPNNWSQY